MAWGCFFPSGGPSAPGRRLSPQGRGGPSAAQCYMARRDVGPRFVPRYRSLLHPTYLRWLLKQKGCGQMQRGSRNLNGVQKVYTENYVSAENNDSYTQYSPTASGTLLAQFFRVWDIGTVRNVCLRLRPVLLHVVCVYRRSTCPAQERRNP